MKRSVNVRLQYNLQYYMQMRNLMIHIERDVFFFNFFLIEIPTNKKNALISRRQSPRIYVYALGCTVIALASRI